MKMNDNNQTAFNNFDFFVDVIKDIVGDWINMHEHYLINRSKISIIYMNFETEVWGAAKAKYLDDKFGKYHFEIDMLEGKNILLTVFDDTNPEQIYNWLIDYDALNKLMQMHKDKKY